MIDLVTKENSFYALYNEPFGDICKAYLVQASSPAMIGLVADAPAPVDKEVTQIAKNVVQFAVQKLEISGVREHPKELVAEILNDIDRQLKGKKLENGVLCCSVIFIYDKVLYVGGVGDCTIALSNERGALRFCHDGADEPRPEGVDEFTVAPAELMGLTADARLGDLPEPYRAESVYQFDSDPSLNIYMFSDGLTKHIPDFYLDLIGRTPDEVFKRVNREIPKDTDALRDDICFTVIPMPPELAPKAIKYPPRKSKATEMESSSAAAGGAAPEPEVKAKGKKEKPPKKPGRAGFWILFLMLLIIMLQVSALGTWFVYEWITFKQELLNNTR